MAKQILDDVGIWINGDDFAGVSNSIALELSAETAESTNFKSGGWREFEPSLKDSTFALEGFFDPAETDRQQFESLGNERSVLVVPSGMDVGDPAKIVPVEVSAHSNSGSIGDMIAMSYAAQGDGRPYSAQVLDIRTEIDSDVDMSRENFGAIPAGHTRRVLLHVKVRQGEIAIDLVSSGAQTGGTLTTHDGTGAITETGLYELTAQSGMLSPITDDWWFLEYRVTGTTDVDVAAATLQGAHHQVTTPITPVTPPTPMPGTVTLKGGISVNRIVTLSQFNIDGVNHQLTFAPFTNHYIIIWRPNSEGDITSVIIDSDPTMQNQVGAFTKEGSSFIISGVTGSYWISTNSLTFPNQTILNVT